MAVSSTQSAALATQAEDALVFMGAAHQVYLDLGSCSNTISQAQFDIYTYALNQATTTLAALMKALRQGAVEHAPVSLRIVRDG